MTTNKPGEDNPICQECGLFKTCRTPFMNSSGASRPDVIIIGEAPGKDEDDPKNGKPFVGEAGQLLHSVVDGLDLGSIRYTNVVRCRPPDNKIEKRHIKYCKQFAMQEIYHYKPKTVLLMGNSPLQGILGESGITSWNGSIIDKTLDDNGKKFDVRFVPLYHPAYILRDSSHLDEWLDAFGSVDATETTVEYVKTYPQNIADLMIMMEHLNSCEYIAYDTETVSLGKYTQEQMLLSVSFAVEGRAYAYPIHHPGEWWQEGELIDVIDITKKVLQAHDGKIIGQNVKFDLLQTHDAFGIMLNASDDVLLISHLIDSKPGIHGLKRQAAIYLDMYQYSKELDEYASAHKEANPKRGGSYAKVPLPILLPYGAKDAEATYRLKQLRIKELTDKQLKLYEDLVIPVCNMLTQIESAGLSVDYYIANRYLDIYNALIYDLLQDILQDKMVKRIMTAREKAAQSTNGKKPKKVNPFNPNSSAQLAELYFTHYHIPIDGYTATNKPSTKADLLSKYESTYPILSLVRYYKLLIKMVSTYLEPIATAAFASRDGKIRTDFNQAGTVTSRISSSKPNVQNIPTPEKEPGTILEILPIKNVFTHSYTRMHTYDYDPRKSFKWMFENGVIMSADFSGMELRTFASLAKCVNMIDIFKIGKDVHSVVSVMSMKGKTPYEVTDREILALPRSVRYKYKWTSWTLLYGGDEFTLHRLYNIPIEEAIHTVKTFYKTFPEILEFGDECVRFAEEHGYIESPFGRREYLRYINETRKNLERLKNADGRAARNMPVQSAASDILLLAGVMVNDILQKSYETRIVNTVHDSLLLNVPVDEIDKVAFICQDIMENVVYYAGKRGTRLDFSWLTCPLKVDIEVGSHYGSLMHIDEWRQGEWLKNQDHAKLGQKMLVR